MKYAYKQSSYLIIENIVRLKKKSAYSKEVVKNINKLQSFLDSKLHLGKISSFLRDKTHFEKFKFLNKRGIFILYSICFSFSATNTYLHVIDALGRLKFVRAAGLLNFKGKLKKNRFKVLKLFFQEINQLKLKFLKNKPVSLSLKNIGAYRRFIVNNLKKKLFVRVILNFQSYSYNGCRKKKKARK